MKKSIVALSAAAALGGLGFAGSAHAIAYFGGSGPATAALGGADPATVLEQNPGGTGHFLFVPYFSAQNGMSSMLNITNTDLQNGKAVKVRFRGAANSDDVLDFTVFLSPGDVWSASVSQGPNGVARLSTNDKSCTLPAIPAAGVDFKAGRADSGLTGDALNAQTREGYVEILNMADIRPTLLNGAGATTSSVNPLFTATKHVNGVAPCTSGPLTALLSTPAVGNIHDQKQAEAAGLAAPTGGMFGSWGVINQSIFALYGGAQTAIRAQTVAGPTGVNGHGNIAFAPQLGVATGLPNTELEKYTADPLLRGASPVITAQWFDLPDMSTPLVPIGAPTVKSPITQTAGLSGALLKETIVNDYSFDPNGAVTSVPMATDWVVSQPTRRYHAAVNYASSGSIVWNTNTTAGAEDGTPVTTAPAYGANVYGPLRLQDRTATRSAMACLGGELGMTDREESAIGAEFSPGTPLRFCGEVFTMSFGGASSVLNASITNTQTLATPGVYGWANLHMGGGKVPIVGFAAVSAINSSTGGNFGMTVPHRW